LAAAFLGSAVLASRDSPVRNAGQQLPPAKLDPITTGSISPTPVQR
jgi:hypothetical protein